MAISFVNSSTAVQNTAATTITINVPSSVADGDLMIMQVIGSGTTSMTTPTGWTVWLALTNSRAIYYRTANSEPASYTITVGSATTLDAYIIAYRDATIDVMGTISAAGSPTVATAITTTANDAYVFASFGSQGSGSVTFTTPTSYTSLVSDSDATAPSYNLFYITQATAGSTGTVSSTPSIGTQRGVLYSIIPTAVSTNNSNFFFMMGA